jgi:LAO/AO transport system kinase
MPSDEETAADPAEIERLAAAVQAGERRALARAITLVESERADHRARARALIDRLLPAAGRATRIAISGVPGVGKSTFIEAFGLHLLDQGRRVAVLAIDPSSRLGGGSILGDKTRMEALSRDPRAYIRPSPTGGTLGGVARRTREAMVLCEAAGFDVVLVETVGVGQSETAAADMTDLFLLLLPPAGGDELQGLKKGIVELADLVVVNKADGDLAAAAGRAAADYQSALHLLRPTHAAWRPPVLTCSALEGRGMDAIWQAVCDHRQALGPEIAARRVRQAKAWLWREIEDGLLERVLSDPAVADHAAALEADVLAGRLSPVSAAERLVARALGRSAP